MSANFTTTFNRPTITMYPYAVQVWFKCYKKQGLLDRMVWRKLRINLPVPRYFLSNTRRRANFKHACIGLEKFTNDWGDACQPLGNVTIPLEWHTHVYKIYRASVKGVRAATHKVILLQVRREPAGATLQVTGWSLTTATAKQDTGRVVGPETRGTSLQKLRNENEG